MIKSISSVKSLQGKRVLVRVDFNVPLEKGRVADDTRIRETLPTLKFLIQEKARVIIMTHVGRPDGTVVEALRVKPVAKALSKLIKKPIKIAPDCIGTKVETLIDKMKDGEIVMLENVRFYEGEEECDPSFSKNLAKLGDLFVNDAFAVSHRAHASVYGVPQLLPHYAGMLVANEVKHLMPLITKSPRPFTLVVGGAKIDTKIGLIKNFFGKADYIIIGGALANTFLAAQGFDVGSSLYEKGKLDVAREILALAEKKKQKIVLPLDVIVADEISDKAKTLDLPLEDVEGEMKILDIGKKTRSLYDGAIKKSKTVVWNGPMGLYEYKPFSGGSRAVALSIAKLGARAQTCIGGGDTLDALARLKISQKKYTFVSTGGGAMLEFLEGKKLPGIEILL